MLFQRFWVYLKNLSSFSEMIYIRSFLFSADYFGRDHSELDIPRIDDGHAYSKMVKS